MKTKNSFFVNALRALFVSFPLVVSTGIIMFAFKQSFGIGLVIMLGLIAVQLIFSMTTDSLKWNEFRDLNFSRSWENERGSKKINIVFNLTRVGTFVSALVFLFKAEVETNPFGGLGLSIAIVVTIIGLLIFLFKSYYEDYKLFRGSLAIGLIVLLIVFSYLYFGTQLIWLPVLFSLAISYSKMFWELDKKEYSEFAILLPILLALTSISSTTIQFWREILDWVSGVFNFIVKVIVSILTFELIYVQLWVILSALIACFIISKTIKAIVKKSAEKAAYLIEVAEENERKEKIAKEKKEKEATMASKANALKNLAAGASVSQDDVLFVIEKPNYFYQEEIAKILTHARLFNSFVVVSNVKKQIFYQPRLSTTLELFNDSFKKVTNDEILNGLIAVIDELVEETTKAKPYKGADELLTTISNTCKDFPQFQKK